MKPIVWKGEASSIAFWYLNEGKKEGRGNQLPEPIFTIIFFFLQKNASCIRIESTVRTRVHQTLLFIPPAIFSKTPPDEETRFHLIHWNRKSCIILSTRSHKLRFSPNSRAITVRVPPLLRATKTRPLKFRPRNSPFERTKRNGREFKAYLRTQIFETVLSAGL